jgi:hypothetical protein
MDNSKLRKWENWWHQFLENAHHFYVVLSLIGMGFSAFNYEKEYFYKFLIGIIAFYYIILWLAFYLQSQKNTVKAKYAEAMALIHKSIHDARDVYRYVEACQNNDDGEEKLSFEKARLGNLLVSCLTAHSKAFSLITGVPCRASIKVIGQGQKTDSDMYVKTLARDYLSMENSQEYDSTESTKHKVLSNTDYKHIFERKIDYFFSNNLPKEGQGYENTSLPNGINNYTEDNWPLPYRSALVWPIRYAKCKDDLREDISLDKKRDQILYGFLTIDCSKKDVFDKNYSVQMGAILADALFPIMQSYRRIARS